MAAVSYKVACMAVLCMVAVAPYTEAAINGCGAVQGKMAPCLGYLRGGLLTGQCCSGVKGLNSMASSTSDRQKACQCLQAAAKTIPNINPASAASLPGKCGVNIPYKISPSTDCTKVT
ncbi:non-specific lipid-transfer protein 2-like [Actinidia eriantha]|uniref:non-specific lipid-transfer protein 2-like n=1 Tax=Actinidia eriantha TaxID=165200 RepID=UPI00258DFC25|nr:non-specific lipid-transfer protein 2-like [Actinidia eriantha]